MQTFLLELISIKIKITTTYLKLFQNQTIKINSASTSSIASYLIISYYIISFLSDHIISIRSYHIYAETSTYKHSHRTYIIKSHNITHTHSFSLLFNYSILLGLGQPPLPPARSVSAHQTPQSPHCRPSASPRQSSQTARPSPPPASSSSPPPP